jgi:hypothetical protein
MNCRNSKINQKVQKESKFSKNAFLQSPQFFILPYIWKFSISKRDARDNEKWYKYEVDQLKGKQNK